MEEVRIGVLGLGPRGRFLLETLEKEVKGARVTAYYDPIAERMELTREIVPAAKAYNSADELIASDVDAVIIATIWSWHIPLAVKALRAGKSVGMVVGGAYSEAELWELVNAVEESGKKFMLLENVCYMDRELSVFRMVREGLFGELVYATGGYEHDLGHQIVQGRERQHGRYLNFLHRSGDLYPTHQLGPVSKCLDINRGNRILTVSSTASKSRGLNWWAESRKGLAVAYVAYEFGYGLSYTSFAYSGLEIKDDEVSLTLENTGPVAGSEVVQLYVGLPSSRIERPVRELRGFRKVHLESGEEKRVTIPLTRDAFTYYDVVTKAFEVEEGDYEISVGALHVCGSCEPHQRGRIDDFDSLFEGPLPLVTDDAPLSLDTPLRVAMRTEGGRRVLSPALDDYREIYGSDPVLCQRMTDAMMDYPIRSVWNLPSLGVEPEELVRRIKAIDEMESAALPD